MRIEYVTYIYHRFKLNANRYSIGGASFQKSRSSYVEQNHSPHQTAISKIWNAFPSFLIQVQTLHPGKTHMELENDHQKQNDQNGDFRMRCIRLWIFRISSSPRVACSHRNRRPRSGCNERNWCALPRKKSRTGHHKYVPPWNWTCKWLKQIKGVTGIMLKTMVSSKF